MCLDIPQGAALHYTVLEDNNGCLTLATVPKMTPRTKHIGVKYFWFRSHVGPESGITLLKVASENQLADTFTKGLALTQFTILRQRLVGWTVEAREGVSKVELTKYLWSLLGTARPLIHERAKDEVRQLGWWKDTERTLIGRNATTSYAGCKHELIFEPTSLDRSATKAIGNHFFCSLHTI
jgi:hypothetical protein